jgi:hypothetical protein
MHALRWLRTLFLQAKAFHLHWDSRTQQALSAIFNKGHLHNFHRHLKAAAGEVQARYTTVLFEAQPRFRRLMRRHETCLEWLQLQLVQLQDAIASEAAFADKQRSTTYRQFERDGVTEPGARRAHALSKLEELVQLTSQLPRRSLIEHLADAEAL